MLISYKYLRFSVALIVYLSVQYTTYTVGLIGNQKNETFEAYKICCKSINRISPK